LLQPTVPKVKINKAGMSGHYPFHLLAWRYPPDQLLGQLMGIDTCGSRQPKGKIGGEIAVFLVAWPFYHDVGHGLQLKQPLIASLLQRPSHRIRYRV
jgi:hypothetical protein